MPSGCALDCGRDALGVGIYRATPDFFPALRIIQEDAEAGLAAASPEGGKKLHGAVRIAFSKIKIFISHDALVLDIRNHSGKDVDFCDYAAPCEIAGDVGGSDLVGVEGFLKA